MYLGSLWLLCIAIYLHVFKTYIVPAKLWNYNILLWGGVLHPVFVLLDLMSYLTKLQHPHCVPHSPLSSSAMLVGENIMTKVTFPENCHNLQTQSQNSISNKHQILQWKTKANWKFNLPIITKLCSSYKNLRHFTLTYHYGTHQQENYIKLCDAYQGKLG